MLKISRLDTTTREFEAVAVPVCQDAGIHRNPAVLNLLRELEKYGEFKGKKGEILTLYERPELNASRVIFVGLGKIEPCDSESFRAACGKCVGIGTFAHFSEMAFLAPDSFNGLKDEEILKAMMEGAYLANFNFEYYKGEKKHSPLDEIYFLLNHDPPPDAQKSALRVETICDAVITARNWVSTPSNDKVPAILAENIANRAGNAGLKVQIFTEKDLKEKGFGATMAVGAGADNPPRLLIIENKREEADKTVALIGKGVTFDSGGMNLKTGKSLALMKSDMAGAAAVAATMIASAGSQGKQNIIALIPIVENMLSASATRTGDIVRSYSGKTIEIGNTDAEGRLILAEAISYAQKIYSPSTIIDLATLTGACITALGEKIAGVFSHDDLLAEKITLAGKITGETCWRMPLAKEYREKLDSEIADINNIGKNPAGGAITAALFLADFVDNVPFAHIDIAGPAFIKKKNAYCGAGGTGFGVRLLCELLERL